MTTYSPKGEFMQQIAPDILLQKRHSVIKIYCKGNLRLINHDDHPVSMRVLLLYQPQFLQSTSE